MSKPLAALIACILMAASPVDAAAPPPAEGARLSVGQLRAKYADPASKYMTIQGVEIHYKDEGSGPAILMVHGSSSSLRTYDRIAELLRGRYRVIRYDIPPLGLSGSISDAAAAAIGRPEIVAEELLTRLGVTKVTAVGVSSGGTMVSFLAARRPDLVERLIISNAPSSSADPSGMKTSQALTLEQSIGGSPGGPGYKRRSFWEAFFDFYSGEPDYVPAEKREEYYQMNLRSPEKNAVAFTAVIANQAFTREAMAKVTAPVLLVWGVRDPLLPGAAADSLAGYLKNAEVSKLMLPDVGHYPPLEVPDRYAQIIAAYIEAATPHKPKAPPPADR